MNFIWYMYYFWYYRNRLCHHCHWYSGIYRVYILDQQTQGLQQIYRYVHCCTNLCPIQSIGNRIDYMYILKQGIERWKTLNTCFCNEQQKAGIDLILRKLFITESQRWCFWKLWLDIMYRGTWLIQHLYKTFYCMFQQQFSSKVWTCRILTMASPVGSPVWLETIITNKAYWLDCFGIFLGGLGVCEWGRVVLKTSKLYVG